MTTAAFPKTTRREFLTQIAAVSAGLAAGCSTLRAGRKIPVGLELYTLRNECQTNFPGMLELVGKTGYRGVEFAGYWGRSAKDIRKMLDDNGLVACGSHTQYGDFQPDKLAATIQFNQIIGNKFIICPYMEGKTRQEWLDKAKEFNDLADQLKPHGLWTGYHAHAHDFELVEGEPAWDIFFGNTKKEVIMQLDTCNCRQGGADPLAILKKYPGRTRTIHIKPFSTDHEAVIGEDQINWPGVFEFCETKGNTEWYVVEHETSKNAVDVIKRSFEALRKFGKV